MIVDLKVYQSFLNNALDCKQKRYKELESKYKPKYKSFLGWLFNAKSALIKFEDSPEGMLYSSDIGNIENSILTAKYLIATGDTTAESDLSKHGSLMYKEYFLSTYKEEAAE